MTSEHLQPLELIPEDLHRTREIHGLIARGVSEGKLLPRSFRDIAESLSEFITYSYEDKIIACGALIIDGPIGTIRSIYVDKQFRGQRLAATMTNQLIQRAKDSRLQEIVLNTDTPGVFRSNGFKETNKPRGMTLVL